MSFLSRSPLWSDLSQALEGSILTAARTAAAPSAAFVVEQ